MRREELKEIIRECIDSYVDESKTKKVVVRGGKRKRITTDTANNRKIVGGKSTTMGAAERIKRSKSQRIASRKKAGKMNRINRKRNKSMKKRSRMGL